MRVKVSWRRQCLSRTEIRYVGVAGGATGAESIATTSSWRCAMRNGSSTFLPQLLNLTLLVTRLALVFTLMTSLRSRQSLGHTYKTL